MAELTRTTAFLDELKEFAVRDLSRIVPGAELLFVHIPRFDHGNTFMASAYGDFVTVIEVRSVTASDLFFDGISRGEEEPMPVIFFERGTAAEPEGVKHHRYASDSGVIPYENWGVMNGYSKENFTVLLSDLAAKGVTPILEPSEELAAAIAAHNENFVPREQGYENWDEDPTSADHF